MIGWLDRLASSWWFGHAILLVVCGGVVGMAALLTPTPDVVSLFGFPIPELCTYRKLFGVGCPGCGLTRSFSFMAHFRFGQAFDMNWMGPPFFLFVASQVPYRVFTLVRGRRIEPPV